MSLVAGTRLGPYVIEHLLGRGGFSRVVAARHAEHGTRHALKCVTPQSGIQRRRALREAALQGALRHPNLVPATDLIETEDGLVIVFDLVRGPSLQARLAAGNLDRADLDQVSAGLLNAVAYLHGNHVVHRDLKPANVLLDDSPAGLRVRLIDFGAAIALRGPYSLALVDPGRVVGTPAYMSPERLAGSHRPAPTDDVYALGCLLYRMFAGRLPFPRGTLEQIRMDREAEDFLPLARVAPDVSPQLSDVVSACLRADPRRRIPDGATLRALFHGYIEPDTWLEGFHAIHDESATSTLPIVPADYASGAYPRIEETSSGVPVG